MPTSLKLPQLLAAFALGTLNAAFAWGADAPHEAAEAPAAPEATEAPIGYVKNTEGDAFIAHLGQEQKAEAGLPVHTGNVLRTGQKSSMGVTFKDGTVMSFGPDTELTVDEYLYAPAQGKLKLGSRLSRGSMNYVSGIISRLRPEAVTIQTPAGTIGTRGTQFVVKVEE